MPSFHNEPNQLLGLPWPHPYVPYESLHIVIPAIQGLIDFLPTIEAKFVNLAPSLKQFSNSNQTTHDCLKQQLKMCQYWPRPRKMYGLPPNSRKPRGHKILKLNLSSLSYDSGRSPRVSVDLAIFYHDTLKAYLPPNWWKRRPRDHKWATKPNHPPLFSFRPPPPCSNVQILKSPTPTYYSQWSCDRVNGDLSDSIFVWSVRN